MRPTCLINALALLSMVCATSVAGPPTYLLLRRADAPGPHGQAGEPPGALQPLPSRGYAYGWFGAPPRHHASRNFGYYRGYTEWSWR